MERAAPVPGLPVSTMKQRDYIGDHQSGLWAHVWPSKGRVTLVARPARDHDEGGVHFPDAHVLEVLSALLLAHGIETRLHVGDFRHNADEDSPFDLRLEIPKDGFGLYQADGPGPVEG